PWWGRSMNALPIIDPMPGQPGRQIDLLSVVLYEIANARSTEQLDDAYRLVSKVWSKGSINDHEAEKFFSDIAAKRPLASHARPFGLKLVKQVGGRISSRFTPRQPPRSPDRQASRDRRRMLGASAVLPHDLRRHYTLGQMSVLCIMAGEVKHHGVCD